MIYPKLAFDGIRKNKRLYLPYILTCVGMVTMTYIIDYLHYSKTVSEMKGGSIIGEILDLGNLVIAFFSCIFLFYTNSFLIKRRKKEFGLYNILGMGKHNLGMIILWETAIVAAISIIAGLAFGILLSKFAELVLLNIIDFGVNRQYDISVSAVIDVTLIFLGIFALLLINSIRQIRFSTAINLLKSESLGEKPPKANWFLGIAGVALLGVAYYLAVTITNPLAAITTFFFAVLSAESLCFGQLNGLSHEEKRRGACFDLYSRDDGACDDIVDIKPLLRRGRGAYDPLPSGNQRGNTDGRH